MTAGLAREHFAAIGDRLDRSPLCVMLDVDGTLAPIAPTPERATVPPETRQVLTRLTEVPDTTVALVSGRAAADAWRIAGVPGAWVIGNHGFEIRDSSGHITADQRVSGFDDAIGQASETLYQQLQGVRGVIVENKRWTLSVHYRLVDDADAPTVIERTAEVARALGLRVLDGKKIVELRPPLDINKGTACVAFLSRVGVGAGRGSALYAGDDRTDEDAFREVRATVRDAVTVRIASAEDAGEMRSNAEFLFGTLPELRELLAWLAERRLRA